MPPTCTAFRSYEPGREEFVTILANYRPFQDPQGGPNFYMFDPEALYEIPRRQQRRRCRGHQLPVPLQEHVEGHRAAGRRQAGQDPADRQRADLPARTAASNPATLNVRETYTAGDGEERPPRRHAQRIVTNASGGERRVRQADRQHRREDLRRRAGLRGPMPASTSTASRSRAARRGARSSSASARNPSTSRSARSSTCST